MTMPTPTRPASRTAVGSVVVAVLLAAGYAAASTLQASAGTPGSVSALAVHPAPLRRPGVTRAGAASRPTASAARLLRLDVTGMYNDPSGDNPGGSPDVTGVTVTSNSNGDYRFTINMPNYSGLAPTLFVYLYLDTDQNPNTGWFGFDYLLAVYGQYNGQANQTNVGRWDGTAWQYSVPASLSATTGFPEVIGINSADIGGTSAFNFWVRAWNYASGSNPPCCYDDAPDSGAWGFPPAAGTTTGTTTTATTTGTTTARTTTTGTTTTGTTTTGTTTTGTTTNSKPPAPPKPGNLPTNVPAPPGVPSGGSSSSPPAPPGNPGTPVTQPAATTSPGTSTVTPAVVKLVVTHLTVSPSRPRVGGTATVKLALIDDTTGNAVGKATVGCATRAPKLLKLTRSTYLAGFATCAWRVGTGARGRNVPVTVTVSASGSRVARTVTLRIRR